jgi:hypothetical protein
MQNVGHWANQIKLYKESIAKPGVIWQRPSEVSEKYRHPSLWGENGVTVKTSH